MTDNVDGTFEPMHEAKSISKRPVADKSVVFEANALLAAKPSREKTLNSKQIHDLVFDSDFVGDARVAEMVIARADITPKELSVAQQQVEYDRRYYSMAYPWVRRALKLAAIFGPGHLPLTGVVHSWSGVAAFAAGALAVYSTYRRIPDSQSGPGYNEGHLVFPDDLTPPERGRAVVGKVLQLRAIEDAIREKWGRPTNG